MGPTGDKQRACELTAGVATYCELMAGPFFLACELMAGVSSRGLTYILVCGKRCRLSVTVSQFRNMEIGTRLFICED